MAIWRLPRDRLPGSRAIEGSAADGVGFHAENQLREVYKHWVGPDSAENVTELQARTQ